MALEHCVHLATLIMIKSKKENVEEESGLGMKGGCSIGESSALMQQLSRVAPSVGTFFA